MGGPVPFAAGPFGAVFILWGVVGALLVSLVLARYIRGVRSRRRAESASDLRRQLLDYTTGLGDTGVIEGLTIQSSRSARLARTADDMTLMLFAAGLMTKVAGEGPSRRLRALLAGLDLDDTAAKWLRDPLASHRALAAEYFARAGSRDAVPYLLHALNDKQRGVRVASAYALVQFATPEVGRRLLAACAGGRGIPRIFASDVAVRMGPVISGEMVKGLTHSSRQVRMVAIDAVAGLGVVEAVPRLEELARTRDHDRDVALRAVQALGVLGRPRSTPVLVECLHPGETAAMRRAACAALGGIGDEAACDVLARLLDGVSDIARQAAEALAATPLGRNVLTLHAAGSGPRARAAAWGLSIAPRPSFVRANLPLTDEDYLPMSSEARRGTTESKRDGAG